MKRYSKLLGRSSCCRLLLLPLWAAAGFAAHQPACADTLVAGRTPTGWSLESPLPPGTEGSDELLIQLCRRGGEPGQTPQTQPRELPALCLVAQAEATTVQRMDEFSHPALMARQRIPGQPQQLQ